MNYLWLNYHFPTSCLSTQKYISYLYKQWPQLITYSIIYFSQGPSLMFLPKIIKGHAFPAFIFPTKCLILLCYSISLALWHFRIVIKILFPFYWYNIRLTFDFYSFFVTACDWIKTRITSLKSYQKFIFLNDSQCWLDIESLKSPELGITISGGNL